MNSFRTIQNDAGLLREYIAIRYGQTFHFGGSCERYFRGMRLARRLARMVKADVETVVQMAIEDSEIFYA